MLNAYLKIALRSFLFLLALAISLVASAQTFQTSDRFDKSADAVVRMGHDDWVEWYCDDSRRGPSGRVEAEKVYCLALHEVIQPVLARRSESEQAFFSDARSLFADLAKTSFVTGMDLSGHSEAWSLPIAESSTAINEAIWLVLQNAPGRLKASRPSEVEDLLKEIEKKVHEKQPEKMGEVKRYRVLVRKIGEIFAPRSAREASVAQAFMVKMGKLTLLNPASTDRAG